MDQQDTIAAVASGIAPARRSVLRVSGPKTLALLTSVFPHIAPDLLDCQRAKAFQTNATISLEGALPRILPARLYFWPDEKSYTGQPSAEIHMLGSIPLVSCLLEELLENGARMAERGEFTLRSFLAGKLDLVQAEAVLAVIEAETPEHLEDALKHLAGDLSSRVNSLRQELIEVTAHVEAGLDFVEEDIEFISSERLLSSLSTIASSLQQLDEQLLLRGSHERLPSVVLVGLPNAGKSTLFNALVGSERAIVTDQAGTTRDAVTAVCEVQGQRFELVDTAGIEELTEQSPRGIAQAVLHNRLGAADLIVYCKYSRTPLANEIGERHQKLFAHKAVLTVATKADLNQDSSPESTDSQLLSFSHFENQGLSPIRSAIVEALSLNCTETNSGGIQRMLVRCKQGISWATENIEQAIQACSEEVGEELVVVELRAAIERLSGVIGEVHTEDILGEIFGRFCIGK